ncbi:MAG: rhodanese-like domain-containing protein [Bdellovibrionota bacterium]
MNIFSLVLVLMTLWACQQKPTKILDESTHVFEKKAVLIDTRNPFQFESFHIEGSQNLWSEDFLILTNPKKKTRMLDPDLQQTVERLASKGIHPDKTIVLLNDKADSIENKKWKWLLSYLEIKNIELKSLNVLKKSIKGQNNRFAKAEAQTPWTLLTSPDFQKDLVLKKAPKCFLKWNDKICL